jgi:hypothetical protein
MNTIDKKIKEIIDDGGFGELIIKIQDKKIVLIEKIIKEKPDIPFPGAYPEI